MEFISSATECIHYAKLAILKYPSLEAIFENKDYDNWIKKINQTNNANLYITSSNINILNTLVFAGYCIDKKKKNSISDYYQGLLERLSLYITNFPQLISDKSFRSKINNLEKLNFLSTLSELSLAYHISKMGYKILFEKKIQHLNSTKRRDIDITVFDNLNNQLHIEVYMPNKQLDIQGFFSLKDDNLHFSRKIGLKLLDKFGDKGFKGLNGMILLGINMVFFEPMYVQTALNPLESKFLFDNLEIEIPTGVDGLLFFEDGFQGKHSFNIRKIILR
ncbi:MULTISPECIES: hypothetical protein [Bacteroidales]|uniref:hypothetical protein n=1 Tax=Bacteroidales TaxID=171549 RepID=UPI0018AB2237|nr:MULTISPECIES: hypothetical protein [Bacteroidales]